MSKDQYEVLEKLGTGTFGTVRKLRRKVDDKTLVWKEINYDGMSEKEKSQLVSEVNILREIRSPFVVRYHDRIVDKPKTRLYIIMEHCAGGDLGRTISKCKKNRTNLDERLIWKILAQSVLALKECHRRQENGITKPVLHRDLKPANILLDANQNIKMGDFGLAKELSSRTRLAQTNVGTPYYMSPEIINERDYDEKSDIWSLGCVLYELAALTPPFFTNNAVSLAVKINAGKFARIPNKYSNELFDAIRSMLQVDPRRRPNVESLEALPNPRMQSAMVQAKSILSEFHSQQANASKIRELRQKEDSLVARESAVKQREQALQEKEAHLVQLEASIRQREKEIQAATAAAAATSSAAVVHREPPKVGVVTRRASRSRLSLERNTESMQTDDNILPSSSEGLQSFPHATEYIDPEDAELQNGYFAMSEEVCGSGGADRDSMDGSCSESTEGYPVLPKPAPFMIYNDPASMQANQRHQLHRHNTRQSCAETTNIKRGTIVTGAEFAKENIDATITSKKQTGRVVEPATRKTQLANQQPLSPTAERGGNVNYFENMNDDDDDSTDISPLKRHRRQYQQPAGKGVPFVAAPPASARRSANYRDTCGNTNFRAVGNPVGDQDRGVLPPPPHRTHQQNNPVSNATCDPSTGWQYRPLDTANDGTAQGNCNNKNNQNTHNGKGSAVITAAPRTYTQGCMDGYSLKEAQQAVERSKFAPVQKPAVANFPITANSSEQVNHSSDNSNNNNYNKPRSRNISTISASLQQQQQYNQQIIAAANPTTVQVDLKALVRHR